MDDELCSQPALPGYHINNSGKLVIESKKKPAGPWREVPG